MSSSGGRGLVERSLQITYRKGRVFGAYLHLSQNMGEKSTRSMATPDGLLVVDYNSAGRPVGVEITAPPAVFLERLNDLLSTLGESPLSDREFRPVGAW